MKAASLKIFLVIMGLCLTSSPVCGESLDDPSAVIFQAMEEEMGRSMRQVKLEDFPAPYFINYQIRHNGHFEVSASLGALLNSDSSQNRALFVDVRVGSPDFDSSLLESHHYQIEQLIPLDNDLRALRAALWYETDLRYKQAIMNFLKKRGSYFRGAENPDLSDFSPPVDRGVHIEEIPPFSINMEEWEKLARKISLQFARSSRIEKSRTKITLDRAIRHYLDSEGRKIRDMEQNYKIVFEAWTKSESGISIHDEEIISFKDPASFPSWVEMVARVDGLIRRVESLIEAPAVGPYVGPAIFSPEASAILFHEAMGHRLEGDRLRTAADGKTFLRKKGELILPPFISVIDDPTMKKFAGKDLMGHYRFDDQGQTGERVVLINRGRLNDVLRSRTPVMGFGRTNGHSRSDGIRTPMSRMSNFFVVSENQVPPDQLKDLLLREVRNQKKPFGLIIKKMISGETQTDVRDFQIFRGKPLYLFKVYPDGREEMVRGVEFVGMPLSLMGKIVATGNDMTVVHGSCTAESGTLPVTTVSSSILLSEVEMQNTHEVSLRKPIIPAPQF